MNERANRRRVAARVLWAMLTKDLKEVIRNKNTLTVLISALSIVVFYRWLPALATEGDGPSVRVFDEGNSALTAYLENSPSLEVSSGYESLAELRTRLANSDVPELGIVIPAGFDAAIEAGEAPPLQGYLVRWVEAGEAASLTRKAEDEIARLLGRRVRIQTAGNAVPMNPESNGLGMQAASAVAFLLIMIGVTLVPHLMVEEKKAHTLDVLLTSPATAAQVVFAKALTGLIYGLAGAGIALAINHNLVVHWWLAIAAVVAFSLFVTSLGLALGTHIDTRAQLTLWAWVVIVPLFFPIIVMMLDDLFPTTVLRIAELAPTAILFNLWRYAFADPISFGQPILMLVWLLLWAGAAMGLVVWLVGRRDRAAEGRGALVREAVGIRSQPTKQASAPLARPVLAHWSTPSAAGTPPRSSARILAAIVAKDLREAVTNKMGLSILVGTAFIALNGAALPLLVRARAKPSAIVYAPAPSTIVRGLAMRDDFRLAITDSRKDFDDTIAAGPGTWLGIALPEDFDQRAGKNQTIELQGYAAHWADVDEVEGLAALFEEQLGLATWGTVRIDLSGPRIYPTMEAGGQITIGLLTMLLAVGAIGFALTPLLFVEEKESHTLDVLLASPASFREILTGKALVGMVYCLLASLAPVLFVRQWVVHWDVIALAAVLSSMFVVSIGVLIGVMAGTPTAAGIWAGPGLAFVLVPVMAQFFANPSWPSIVGQAIAWMPGPLLFTLYRLASIELVPAQQLWSSALALAGMAGLVLLLAAWRVQRLSR